jgi:hypothetical protein
VHLWPCPGSTRWPVQTAVPGLTVPYGRRTRVLRFMLEKIAVASAWGAGAGLARSLQAIVGCWTMLRVVMVLPDPSSRTPRELGGG